ncbi:MAG: threonine--tRNA ligase [Candidatus Doudnabacteria bacterium]|nr:threonine--tRNA ligase [Candidatus Doudnabacteria bacterium]
MDNQKLFNIRHSLAHIMAAAVGEMFPKANLGVGPVVENGFYYDFLLPRPLTPEDLKKLEKRMRALVQEKLSFERMEMSFKEAKKFFSERGQTFKVELINDIEKFGTTNADLVLNQESKNPVSVSDKVSLYKSGKFIDLCRGPHVANTSEIKSDAFKLNKISGAYWRGDQTKPQLQRIYGLAFETKEELEKYLKLLEEAEKRDHKILGPKLDLFMFHETAPGMPYWLPKGVILYNELVSFWRQEHKERGYQEIVSPLLNKKGLYVTSGHFEHYWENMFTCKTAENEEYGVKAMNCPNAHVVFASKLRSYRDLPLRFGDTDTLHRFELSGALNGLLRVREFRQDDAHIYLSEDMVESEYKEVFKIIKRFYSAFGIKYSFRLGTRPEKFMGDTATWDRAEVALEKILKSSGVEYHIEKGDGAFYGPKVDILMKDALERQWQMGTVQLDFQQPRRFNLEYIDKDGSRKIPVCIHRVIYGSLERFIGILIEHYAGAFPLWLAPVQVAILPISKKQNGYAKKVLKELTTYNSQLRTELDDRDESVGKKIRDASMQKIPYQIIVGEKEVKSKKIAVRTREGKDLGQMGLKKFMKKIQMEIEKKK